MDTTSKVISWFFVVVCGIISIGCLFAVFSGDNFALLPLAVNMMGAGLNGYNLYVDSTKN